MGSGVWGSGSVASCRAAGIGVPGRGSMLQGSGIFRCQPFREQDRELLAMEPTAHIRDAPLNFVRDVGSRWLLWGSFKCSVVVNM